MVKVYKIAQEARLACAGVLVRLMPSARRIQPGKVVFCNHRGSGYGCNPKYVAEALRAHGGLDLVWLSKQRDPCMPSSIRWARYGSIQALRELATAAAWVDNARTRRHVPKKPGQFYLQTWHGCLTPKKVEADVQDVLSRTYLRGARQDARETDLMPCNNDFFEPIMRTSFFYDGPIVRCGLPRNAPLVHDDPEVRQRVRNRLGVPEGMRVCLYAPTYKGDGAPGVVDFDFERCCQALQRRFGDPFVVVLRRHPNEAGMPQPRLAPQVLDASGYGDPIELLCASDVLVSDYSSMLEDFALLGRPGYQLVVRGSSFEQMRGLYYPLEERPFPLAHTPDELFDAILSTSDEQFGTAREAFFARVGLHDDGNGAEVLAQAILDALARREGALARDTKSGEAPHAT